MLQCTNCKTPFVSKDPRNTGRYCSKPCMRQYRHDHGRTRKVEKNGYFKTVYDIDCINCGQPHEACRRTAKYCGSRCQMAYEYSHSARNRATIANAAHDAVRTNGQPKRKGLPIPQLRKPEVWAKVSASKTGKQVPKLQGKNHWNWKGGVDKLSLIHI